MLPRLPKTALIATFVLLICSISFLVSADDAPCQLNNHQNGARFDLSPLKRDSGDDWKVTPAFDTEHSYYLNICHGLLFGDGKWSQWGVYQRRTGSSDNAGFGLGRSQSMLMYRDGELMMNFNEGDVCENDSSRKRQTVIHFLCDKSIGPGQPKLLFTDGCLYTFSWISSVACMQSSAGAGGLSIWSIMFIIGIVVGVVYCTCGVFYKRSQGAIGLEQIPNIEVWKSVWSRLGDLIDKIRGKRRSYNRMPTDGVYLIDDDLTAIPEDDEV